MDINQTVERMNPKQALTEKLKDTGLPLPTKPLDLNKGVNIITEWDSLIKKHGGIANVPFHELGTYLDRWTELLAYGRYIEAGADINRIVSLEIKEQVRNMVYTQIEGNRELRAAAVHTDEKYIEWAEKALKDQTYFTMIKALVAGYEQRVNAISREITRRSSDFKDTGRAYNRGNL